jgi:hypothetical protein
MAKTSSWGFSNTTGSTHKTITPVALGLVTNYALADDQADAVVLDNKTAPLDQQETITFRYREIPKVNTNVTVQYPAPVTVGCQYIVSLEEVLKTEDASVGYRVDDPIVAQLTIRHPKSGNISSSHIETILTRLVGALYADDGTCRINDLMRSALKPVSD